MVPVYHWANASGPPLAPWRQPGASTAAVLPLRRQRPRLPGPVDAPAGAGLRRDRPRREHGPGRVHDRARARQRLRRAPRGPNARGRSSPSPSSKPSSPSPRLRHRSGLRRSRLVYVRLHGALGDWPLLVGIVRLVLSFAVLMVPATLMGATLPLVVKSALAKGTILGRQVSLLYACNTAGAVAGALVAGIWMIPQLGISWAFRFAAAINLVVAVAALVLARRTAPRRGSCRNACAGRACRLGGGGHRPGAVTARPPPYPADVRRVRLRFIRPRDHLVPDARAAVPADDLCLHRHAGDGARRHRDWQRPLDAAHQSSTVEPAGSARRPRSPHRPRRGDVDGRHRPRQRRLHGLRPGLRRHALLLLRTDGGHQHRCHPAAGAADGHGVSDRHRACGRRGSRRSMPASASASSTPSTSPAPSPARCSRASSCSRRLAAASACWRRRRCRSWPACCC